MLTELQITNREPYEAGKEFGEVGAYERIDGVARYALDPLHPANAAVVDLAAAPRDAEGLVRFSGDVTMLVPVEPGRARGTALLEVPNRGNRLAPGFLNRAPTAPAPTAELPAGDGFLFRHGWTVAWCGWQWDVPRSAARMGLDAPQALDADGAPIAGWVQLRIQLHQPRTHVLLTDHHTGAGGDHQPLPAAGLDQPDAVLWVRDSLHAAPAALPRSAWRFARERDGRVAPDDTRLWVEGGLVAGRIYDLVYRTRICPVAGAGLAAVRDFAAFLRADRADNPAAGAARRVIAEGASQCGRFLRTLLHLGMDLDEAGQPVFDGLLVHIAGGRRGEFNHRYAQPSVQPTPSFGHRFPFADAAQLDPRTGLTDGILARQLARAARPKVFTVNTSAEYWRGDASLTHTSAADGSDLDPPPEVRSYLLRGAQHGPGLLPLSDRSPFGSHGQNPFNVIDYTPLLRAALDNLAAWVERGVEPPASAVPRLGDGTALSRQDALARLATIPGLGLPDPAELARLEPLELGPDAARGVGAWPAAPVGEPYPCWVAALDADGNEVAGLAMPDVAAPVATHTGFNPRHADSGGVGQLIEYVGSTLPFPATAADRAAAGDPRPSLAERYGDRHGYETQVRAAAKELAAQRTILEEDVELCVRIALRRYDACAAYTRE
ncbi:MAG: alpha/beta hydrolase domain-containing protein [Acidimicrobiales bacterium]